MNGRGYDLADAITEYADDGEFDVPIIAEAVAALRAGAEVVSPGDLLGTKEAAALLKIDRTTVARWRGAGYLPAPFQELATGPVWLRSRLDDFAEKHAATADAAGRRPVGTAR